MLVLPSLERAFCSLYLISVNDFQNTKYRYDLLVPSTNYIDSRIEKRVISNPVMCRWDR